MHMGGRIDSLGRSGPTPTSLLYGSSSQRELCHLPLLTMFPSSYWSREPAGVSLLKYSPHPITGPASGTSFQKESTLLPSTGSSDAQHEENLYYIFLHSCPWAFLMARRPLHLHQRGFIQPVYRGHTPRPSVLSYIEQSKKVSGIESKGAAKAGESLTLYMNNQRQSCIETGRTGKGEGLVRTRQEMPTDHRP